MIIIDKDEYRVEDFQAVIELFKQDAGGNAPHTYIDPGYIDRFFLSGELNEEMNELMLRLDWRGKRLIVAGICFIHQRKGYGAKLFDMLMDFAKEHDYQTLIVESVHTDSMKSFLMKNGFELASEQEFEFDWIKKVE